MTQLNWLLFAISVSTWSDIYAFQSSRRFPDNFILRQTFPVNQIPSITGNNVRGSTYGLENNSTIPTPEQIAQSLGVRPTKANVTKNTWSTAWKLQKMMIPILHMFDSCKPVDSSLNLACMWWKALAGNDLSSPAYDNGLAYDMLPRFMRRVISQRMIRFYPRLHHANVELRTVFLDKAILQLIRNLINENNKSRPIKVRLIFLGAGYDTRCLRVIEKDYPLIEQIYDLDLPRVIIAKERLIQRRLLKRRPWLRKKILPILRPIDLNDLEGVRETLSGIIEHDRLEPNVIFHTIFVFEGVMIYLNEGIPSQLLHVISDVLKAKGSRGSLCFADRLEQIPGGDKTIARHELLKHGWTLQEWCPKPGLARHMGTASMV